MKNLTEDVAVVELSSEEMLDVDGGNVIGDVVYAIGYGVGTALAWLRDNPASQYG